MHAEPRVAFMARWARQRRRQQRESVAKGKTCDDEDGPAEKYTIDQDVLKKTAFRKNKGSNYYKYMEPCKYGRVYGPKCGRRYRKCIDEKTFKKLHPKTQQAILKRMEGISIYKGSGTDKDPFVLDD